MTAHRIGWHRWRAARSIRIDQARVIVDLYQGFYQGEPLGPGLADQSHQYRLPHTPLPQT